MESRKSLPSLHRWDSGPGRRGAYQGCTARYGTQGSEVPPPQGTAYLSHILLSPCSWLSGPGEGRVAPAPPYTPHPNPTMSHPPSELPGTGFPMLSCRLREGANREILGIIVSYKVKVKLVVSRGG